MGDSGEEPLRKRKESFNLLNTTILVFTYFVASMIQSLCGFGSAIFAMSVLPHFYNSYSFSLMLSTLLSFAICAFIIIKEYRHVNIRLIIPMIIGNALAVTFVMFFWSGDTGSIMKKILGCFLILLSLYFIFYKMNIKIKPTFQAGLLSGILGGIGNTFFSIGSPPIVLYMIVTSKDSKEYIASSQAYFCFSAAYVTIPRYMRGMISEDVWPLFLVGLPFIALGTWMGMKLFGILNKEKLRLIIYIFMAVSGAVMVLSK